MQHQVHFPAGLHPNITVEDFDLTTVTLVVQEGRRRLLMRSFSSIGGRLLATTLNLPITDVVIDDSGEYVFIETDNVEGVDFSQA